MQILELILSGIAGIALFLFGIVLANYNKRIDNVEKKGEHIETNYNDKFDKVHAKLDHIINMYHEFDKKMDIHIAVSQQQNEKL